MKDIFITETFRNDWNKNFNLKLATTLEIKGYNVFLPQRDSEQLGNRKTTFLQNTAGIDQCKIIVAIGSKTQTANWGFEIGYAYKSNFPVIIITDNEHPVELMPEGAAVKIIQVANLDHLESYFEELVAAINKTLQD